MLYPNLQININKKRGVTGLDDTSAQDINTPVILDMAVQMSEEKDFMFGPQQPSLNQFKLERQVDDKQHMNQMSLQTPIIDINNSPFFNQTSTAVSPGDALNSFVAPNDILNTYTTVPSSTSTSTTSAYNDLNQSNHMTNHHQTLNHHHHPLSMPNKLLSLNKQHQQQHHQHQHQQELHQNDYIFATTPYTSAQQIGQYNSNILNQTDLNDNLAALTHSHMAATQEQHQQHPQQTIQQNLTYTELKPPNQQTHLIPHSVLDIAGYKKHQDHQPSYMQPSSPTNSLSSQTSSSNMDNLDGHYMYPETSGQQTNRMARRYPGQSSSMSQNEKKSRMTKKQKYDAMINEEKSLLKNNEQLKNDIKELENMILRYKKTIMDTVKKN